MRLNGKTISSLSKRTIILTIAISLSVLAWTPYAHGQPGPNVCTPAPSGLVSWWGFEGNANDLQDGNSGVVSGSGSQFVPGEVGLGFESGGPGSLVVVPDSTNLFTPQFTIDVWVKINVLTTTNMPIVWRGDNLGTDDTSGYSLSVFGSPGSFSFTPGAILSGSPAPGKLLFVINNGTTDQAIISNVILPFGSGSPFVHVAATVGGSNMVLYINGLIDTAAGQVVTPVHHTFPFQIGSATGAVPGFYFGGIIDELDYFNRALSQTEVQSILNAGTAGKCGGGIQPFVGRVCLAPGDTLACPQTLPVIRADSTGHATVSVNILGSAIFNAISIRLRYDPTTMNGTGIDLTGTILPGPTVNATCINLSGLGCTSQDSFGTAFVSIFGSSILPAPVSGQLFKVTFAGLPGTTLPIGFATGCSPTILGLGGFGFGSVPNTEACVTVGIVSTGTAGITPVPEELQSQSFGDHLPTALSSVIPPGNITDIHSGSSAPTFADTYILPYRVSLPGNITSWKAQFVGGNVSSTLPIPSVPASVQLKVLRPISTSVLQVVEVGRVHDPRSVLAARIPGYPFMLTEWTVIPYYSDSSLMVIPGDFVGITITSNATLGAFYNYPFENFTGGTRFVQRNVPFNGTIDLSDVSTGIIPGLVPAVEVTIQPSPPSLDTSGGGIPDFVALSPEMQALGVDPCRKNVLVQIDYMVNVIGGYTHKPLQQALDIVTAAFDAAPVSAVSNCPYHGFPRKTSGINLVLDVENAIPQQDVLNYTQSAPFSFDALKANFLDPTRARYFHYGIFAHNVAPESTVSGASEIFGSNFIVSLGGWTNNVGTAFEQAGTLMHELGHNLGLEHGGVDSVNFKPNYESVMNYEHQVVGVITRTPTGDLVRFDYSREALPTLNENNLTGWTRIGSSSSSNDYTKWVCPDHHTVKIDVLSNLPDWNCNGVLAAGVQSDVNNDTVKGPLNGYDDWANIQYDFAQGANFQGGCLAHCDIGCLAHCDIGCLAHCDIGTGHLDFRTAQAIEATWTAFIASPHRPTSTAVSCSPSTVVSGTPTLCNASVTDVGTGSPVTPMGMVSFQSSQPGTFAPATCMLSGAGATSTCSVSYTPSIASAGPQTITSGYTGDTSHLGSNGSTVVNGLSLPVVAVTSNTTLTSDMTGRIVVGADNVTLNCGGHTITGITTAPIAGTYPGILLNDRTGVVVENCRVTNFYIGIQLISSTKSLIFHDSTVSNGYGYSLSMSSLNALVGDNATSNSHDGFRIVSSSQIGLAGDRANNNLGSGFLLIGSSRNIMGANVANGNGAYGFALTSSSNSNLVLGNTACSNTVSDAFQDSTSTGNLYRNDTFCTSSGLPPPPPHRDRLTLE